MSAVFNEVIEGESWRVRKEYKDGRSGGNRGKEKRGKLKKEGRWKRNEEGEIEEERGERKR